MTGLRAATWVSNNPGLNRLVSEILDRKTSETIYTNDFQNDIYEVLGISEGDLEYLRENGHVDRIIVDDDWRLDEDGNWPEVD